MAAEKLVIERVCKSFGRVAILRDVSLSLKKGEVLALIGPSGAGKSTLLRCINHLETIDTGFVAVDGVPIGYRLEGTRLYELGDKEIARQRAMVGMVFQHYNLFRHLTARWNVMLGLRKVKRLGADAARAAADAALERVGLDGFGDRYPSQLSGGQQQRVAIARALAMNPSLLLLDEPTSALDPELRSEVVDVIRLLAGEGRTMVLATHDLDLASAVADRVAFLDQGEVVEIGPADRVLHQPTEARTRAFVTRLQGSADPGSASSGGGSVELRERG